MESINQIAVKARSETKLIKRNMQRKNTKNTRIKRNMAKKNTKINTMTEKSTKIIQCCNLKAKELVEIAHTPRVVTVLNRCCCKKSIAYFAAALSNFNLPLIDTFYSLQFSLLCSFLPFLLLLLIPSFVAVLRC